MFVINEVYFPDLDLGSQMIIFQSILITFIASVKSSPPPVAHGTKDAVLFYQQVDDENVRFKMFAFHIKFIQKQ